MGPCGRVIAVCTVGIGGAVGGIWTPAPANSPLDIRSVDALMLRLMATDNVPSAALVLIQGGRVVLEKNYGFRDLTKHAPVTARALFNIGSISKSFTALAVAQLVDHHDLDLDTPIIGYVPEV